MKKNTLFATIFAFSVLLPSSGRADEVRLRDGTIINGVILGVEAGVLSIKPGYSTAGDVKPFSFKISDILTFSTEEPIFIGTAAAESERPDNVSYGKVDGTPSGIRVITSTGTTSSEVKNVKAAWRTPEESPQAKELKKMERHWAVEVVADFRSKTGNTEQLGASFGFSAINSGKDDTLTFFGKYNYYRTDDNKSTDDLSAGVDYNAKFTELFLWYARTNNGFNKINRINFYSESAVGAGLVALGQEDHKLKFRLGLLYRYETYNNGENFSKPGIDAGLQYLFAWSWGKFEDNLSYMPVFEEFGNFLVKHEAAFEFPLGTSEHWKIRVGVSNEYNSRPLPGVKRLDTTFFTRIVLRFK
ncbi:MAG: DUF481 domain-containing protein [Puniceicoccales bacterium]|jgi:hypothetical protein|nr:DUF481 domain-containing protein [Puniceicoccales bacterium]